VIEAANTTTSTGQIWVIVVVAVVLLAVWLVGISVADNIQIRESHRWRQQRDAEAALGAASAVGTVEEGTVKGGTVEPGTVETGTVEPGRGSATAAVPAQARSSYPTLPTLDGAGDFRRDAAEAGWRTEAAAQAGLPSQRSAGADRAERSYAGPDADRADDDAGGQA
jgi:hypothetical protein